MSLKIVNDAISRADRNTGDLERYTNEIQTAFENGDARTVFKLAPKIRHIEGKMQMIKTIIDSVFNIAKIFTT